MNVFLRPPVPTTVWRLLHVWFVTPGDLLQPQSPRAGMLLRKERTKQEFETGAIGSKKENTTYDISGNKGLSSSNNNTIIIIIIIINNN
jgi:hypothetical protein